MAYVFHSRRPVLRMRCSALLIVILTLPASTQGRCAANEILLRNRTCHCPFFKLDATTCLRRRYQTTINSTLDSLWQSSRHLLSSSPLLLTIDASNYEAMMALAASLNSIQSIGTAVTRVVDSMDTLVGGDASATLEIVNVTVDTTRGVLGLTVDCRFPEVDYFYLYVHTGRTVASVCPPFDPMNRCCRGDMSSTEYSTADNVDCTSNDPYPALDRFVRLWNGAYQSEDKQLIYLSIDLAKVPLTIDSAARVFSVGVGMVVFGKLAQNTESHVELILNTTSITTSYGTFQYSGIEYSRLQLERGCGNNTLYAHLIVKAAGIESVQNVRFQNWDGGEWAQPNCTSANLTTLGALQLSACNVSLDSDFVDIYISMRGMRLNRTTTVYVLLQRGSVLTRVVAKTDDTVISHCLDPVAIDAGTNGYDAVTVEIMQGSKLKYAGPLRPIQLTDVAALNIRLISKFVTYSYSLDNVSVVYSLVDSKQITALMPDGLVTPALEQLCDDGNVCLIEDLMIGGACQVNEKCELQGDSVFLMPLFPWGTATLKQGTYTVMTAQIKEHFLPQGRTATNTTKTGIMRRLFGWALGT